MRVLSLYEDGRRVERDWTGIWRFLRKFLTYGAIAFVAILMYLAVSKVYPFNWSVVLRYRALFMKGLLVTLKLSLVSLGMSFALGVVFAVMRVSRIEFLRDVAFIYVWLFRNLPLLVVILLTYYGVGSIVNMDRFWAAAVALSLFEGAYMTEIIRAGMEAVDRGEIEAALALGMSNFQVFSSIIFPQALRISLPPLVGQAISLIKDSSLASVIALGELTMMGRQVGTSSFATFESYITVAAIYLLLTSVLSVVGRYLERRWSLS